MVGHNVCRILVPYSYECCKRWTGHAGSEIRRPVGHDVYMDGVVCSTNTRRVQQKTSEPEASTSTRTSSE
eukprot:scaffold271987_cov33-Prasinocladus_malaysianus.AAC.1